MAELTFNSQPSVVAIILLFPSGRSQRIEYGNSVDSKVKIMRVAVTGLGRLIFAGLLLSSSGVVAADTARAEAQLMAEVEQLKAAGKHVDALVLLRQASVSCVQCGRINKALADVYCGLGDYGRAAQVLNQPRKTVCGGSLEGSAIRPSLSHSVEPSVRPAFRQLQEPNVAPKPAKIAGGLQEAVARAKQMLSRGEASAAYQLLKPFDAQALGDTEFDYLVGVASLDSGRPGEAVFSLSRVVAEQPNFLGARLELGRAFFERGDYQHAQRIFQELSESQPPKAAARVIDRYLDAIRFKTSHQRRSVTGYLEAGIGIDSNASAGTDVKTVGIFLLDPSARRQSSVRREVGIGVEAKLPLGARWQALAAADGRVTDFTEADFVSGNTIGASAGLAYRRHSWRAQGLLAANYQTFDSQFNHVGRHAVVNVERLIGDNWRLQLGYKAGRAIFAQELSVLNVDQHLLSTGFSHSWSGKGQPAMSASVLLGRDGARDAGSPFGKNLGGLRAQYARGLGPGRLYLTGSFLNSNYHGSFGAGLGAERRKDAQQWLSLSWAIEHWPYRNWRVAPEILLLNNDSSVELYDHQRGWLMLTLRRQFERGER